MCRQISLNSSIAERLGMTLAEVQLLVAHARREAEHEGFRVSAVADPPKTMLNHLPGIFSAVIHTSHCLDDADFIFLLRYVCIGRKPRK